MERKATENTLKRLKACIQPGVTCMAAGLQLLHACSFQAGSRSGYAAASHAAERVWSRSLPYRASYTFLARSITCCVLTEYRVPALSCSSARRRRGTTRIILHEMGVRCSCAYSKDGYLILALRPARSIGAMHIGIEPHSWFSSLHSWCPAMLCGLIVSMCIMSRMLDCVHIQASRFSTTGTRCRSVETVRSEAVLSIRHFLNFACLRFPSAHRYECR